MTVKFIISTHMVTWASSLDQLVPGSVGSRVYGLGFKLVVLGRVVELSKKLFYRLVSLQITYFPSPPTLQVGFRV